MVLYKNNIKALMIIWDVNSSAVARISLDFSDSKILKGACVGKRIFFAILSRANFNYFTVTLQLGIFCWFTVYVNSGKFKFLE